jgi:hypothetical protein
MSILIWGFAVLVVVVVAAGEWLAKKELKTLLLLTLIVFPLTVVQPYWDQITTGFQQVVPFAILTAITVMLEGIVFRLYREEIKSSR